jgi:hypothetical protein
MKELQNLLRSFYNYGHLTNSKSYYLYKNNLSKINYYEHFYLNFIYCSITQNLNLSLENKFTAENLKEEFKLNNYYNENNIGLFIFPNLCLKNMYTINKAKKLNTNEKKIFNEIMLKELESIKKNFETYYNNFEKNLE